MYKCYEFQNVIDFGGQQTTLWIQNGEIKPHKPESELTVIDAQGYRMIPALVELFANFKEPGGDHYYSIQDGFKAMLKGGYKACLLSPNTAPVLDQANTIQRITQKAHSYNPQIIISGALSMGLEGKYMPSVEAFHRAGAKFLSNATQPIPNTSYLRSIMEYAAQFETRLFLYPLEGDLAGKVSVHEGAYSSLLGIKGIPLAAEEIAVYKIISLAFLSKCPIHLHGLTSPSSLSLVEKAKNEGLDITCDVAVHSLIFTEECLLDLNTNHHLCPPIRTNIEKEALIQGLKNNVVDAITGFHTPVHNDLKQTYIEASEPGVLSLETTWAALNTYVPELSECLLIDKLSIDPGRILGLENTKQLEFFLWNADTNQSINSTFLQGPVNNSPFFEQTQKGKILGSYIQGKWYFNGV